MYQLISLSNTTEVIASDAEIAPLFSQLKDNQVIVKGKKREIVAGKPAGLLDIMERELAHTPELLAEHI